MCVSFEIPKTVIISSFHCYIITLHCYVLRKISKTVFKIYRFDVGRPKTAKLLMKQGQIGYVWSAISKTVFKIFLDPKSRKIWIFQNLLAKDGVGRPKPAKTLMKHGQFGYVWSAISKTVFNFFLDQKSRKIWIFQNLLAENGVRRPEMANNGKTVNETRPDWLHLKRDFQNCL